MSGGGGNDRILPGQKLAKRRRGEGGGAPTPRCEACREVSVGAINQLRPAGPPAVGDLLAPARGGFPTVVHGVRRPPSRVGGGAVSR